MKRYIMWLLGLLILSACTNDEYLAQRTEVEEGIPTVVKLSVAIPMSGKIETKAFSDSGVADLYVFSFKKDDDEFITIERYTLEESIANIWNGEICDSKTIAGILAYKEYLSNKN